MKLFAFAFEFEDQKTVTLILTDLVLNPNNIEQLATVHEIYKINLENLLVVYKKNILTTFFLYQIRQNTKKGRIKESFQSKHKKKMKYYLMQV